VRLLATSLVVCTGCTAIFGLEEPVRRVSDGGVIDGVPDARPRDARAVDAPPVDAPLLDGLVCPVGYAAISGSTSKYRIDNNNETWDAAEADCESDGQHLIVVSNETERAALVGLTAGSTWIGLSDRATEGTFRWVTDEDTGGYPPATGTPWAAGEPSADTVASDCTLQSTTWNDAPCTLNREYVCECDGYAANPAHY